MNVLRFTRLSAHGKVVNYSDVLRCKRKVFKPKRCTNSNLNVFEDTNLRNNCESVDWMGVEWKWVANGCSWREREKQNFYLFILPQCKNTNYE